MMLRAWVGNGEGGFGEAVGWGEFGLSLWNARALRCAAAERGMHSVCSRWRRRGSHLEVGVQHVAAVQVHHGGCNVDRSVQHRAVVDVAAAAATGQRAAAAARAPSWFAARRWPRARRCPGSDPTVAAPARVTRVAGAVGPLQAPECATVQRIAQAAAIAVLQHQLHLKAVDAPRGAVGLAVVKPAGVWHAHHQAARARAGVAHLADAVGICLRGVRGAGGAGTQGDA